MSQLASDTPKDLEVLTDKTGRSITVRVPDILVEAMYVAMLGDNAANAAYMGGYALPVLYTAQINEEILPVPQSQLELNAAIKQLDRDGLNCVAGWMIKRFKAPAANADNKEQETIKK